MCRILKGCSCLTESFELEGVASEPGGAVGSTHNAVGPVSAFPETACLASGAGESAAFPVLVDTLADPVDAGVVADEGVVRVDQNDLVVFHGGVLVDPVRVEDTEIGELASHLFFGHRLEVALKLELVDTLVLGLTKDHTTVVLTLASSAADTATDNDVTGLGLVTQTMSLVGTGRTVATGNLGTLTVFPSTHTHQKTKSITLLVTPQLFQVLVGGHLYCSNSLLRTNQTETKKHKTTNKM